MKQSENATRIAINLQLQQHKLISLAAAVARLKVTSCFFVFVNLKSFFKGRKTIDGNCNLRLFSRLYTRGATGTN